jgi:hypothetical protein
MYQADFICTYKLMDSFEEQEDLYRIQLLQAFDLEKIDVDKINISTEELLKTLSSSDEFKQIINKARESTCIKEVINSVGLSIEDDNVIFKMLFTYDYFDLLHWCICDFVMNGSIKPVHLNNLLYAL